MRVVTLMKETIRTHVVLPKDLVEAVDRMVGQRRRSQCVEEAVKEKVFRERQVQALEQYAGILDPAKYPEWDSPDKISAWVRGLREEADAATARKLTRQRDV